MPNRTRFEVIRKCTPKEDRDRLVAGMRFMAKEYPKKYGLVYSTYGDLILEDKARHLIAWPIMIATSDDCKEI